MVSAIPMARLPVGAPARTPLPYGLLSVAQVQTVTDVHWRNGVWFEPDTCEEAGITTDSCAASGTGNKPITSTMDFRASAPFTVYTLPQCSAVGYLPDQAQPRAAGALTAGEGRAVEREFWTGAHGTTPHLAEDTIIIGTDGSTEQSAAAVVVTGGVDVVEGIALLEEALGTCYGNEGVIHVPLAVLTHMKWASLAERDGARLRSPSGHLIAAGAGYPGTSPAGAPPPSGVRWIYATGAVSIWRSGIDFYARTPAEILDRNKNTVVMTAERTYVIGWDCCHLAIPITIGGTDTGAVGS